MAALPLVAIGVDAWGVVYYRQGARNETMDFAPSAVAVAIVLSLAIAGLLLRGYVLTRRGDARTTSVWLLVLLVMMLWPAMCAMRPTPIERYREGLADWARAHVDINGLRAWHAAMSTSTATTATTLPAKVPVNSPLVPAGARGLNPSVVELHRNGVLLQWGERAVMPGRARKLFVGVDASTQPPDEGRRFWVEAQPGVYVGTDDPP